MKRLLLFALVCLLALGAGARKKPQHTSTHTSTHTFEIKDGKFLLDHRPFQFICGEMHYPRIPQEYWRDRIRRIKAMGVNTVSAYVFWSMHEPQPGQFCFDGQADIAKFVRTCGEEGMHVVLRPGPYVCAEWDFGGYPYWLQNDSTMVWRSDNPAFLSACKRYIDRLGQELAPLMVTRGGPVLLVQVENEYGSYAKDKVYLGKLRDMLVEAGFDVPLITCDGPGQMPNGQLPGLLPTVNGAVGEQVMQSIDRFHPGGPYFVAEFYPAWFDEWGNRHSYRDYHGPTNQLKWMLEHNVSVSIYMSHGGTNFTYQNGANSHKTFEPQPTSYDYDAPLGEYGNITPKYLAFRQLFEQYLPKGEKLPPVPEQPKTTRFAPVQLTQTAPLSAAFAERRESARPLTMEDLGQDYGYVHYETTLQRDYRGTLHLKELRDYAVVLCDGQPLGSLDRRLRADRMEVDLREGQKLEILVENGGRVNYGPGILDNKKGITEGVFVGEDELLGWTSTPLPLYRADVSKFRYQRGALQQGPAFYRGEFRLDSVADTFIDMRGWGKGAVWVNGRSIGKYWYIGPQQTLYMPAPWLHQGRNEIVVMDMENTGHHSLCGLPQPVLDEVHPDRIERQMPGRDLSREPIIDEGDCVLTAQMEQKDGEQRFQLPQAATLRHLCLEVETSYDGQNACLNDLTLYGADGKPLSRKDWTVVYVSSEQPLEGDCEQLFDGKPLTYWHTLYKDAPRPFPHRIILDLGEIQTATAIGLRQRSASQSGCVKDFKVYARPQFFLFE